MTRKTSHSDLDRMMWYIEHRLEYLEKRQTRLKESIETASSADIDYDALKEFMENKGRVNELMRILAHMDET